MENNEQEQMFYHSRKGRRLLKFKKQRKIINIVASIVLVASFVITAAMTAGVVIASQKYNGMPGENAGTESGDFENLMVSTHSGVSYILVCGVDVHENLTDIIAVACIDHDKKTLNFIQIPRDTFIGEDIPSMKINAVYGSARQGEHKINALRRRLGTALGIPLDHYVIFTIEGFMNVIDALDGIEINITQPGGITIENQKTYEDYKIGPGWVTLDGNMAAGFVRKRYGEDEGYKMGDPDRLKAQRLMYVALAKKLQAMNLKQMASIASSCYDQISTDMSINDIIGYAKEVKEIPFDSFKIFSVPGQNCDYAAKGFSKKLSYYSVHKQEYVDIFNNYFNPYGDKITADNINIRELYREIGDPYYKNYLDPEGGSISDLMQDNNQQK